MKRLSLVTLLGFMMVLTMVSCKDDKKENKNETTTSQTTTDKDKDKDKDKGKDKVPVNVRIGDQCHPGAFRNYCEGQEIVTCAYKYIRADGRSWFITSVDDFSMQFDVSYELLPFSVTNMKCPNGAECRNVTFNGVTEANCVNVYDSCTTAFTENEIDPDEAGWACEQIDMAELRRMLGDDSVTGEYFSLSGDFYQCVDTGDAKYTLLNPYHGEHLCSKCSVNNNNISFSCESDAILAGANAKEGDKCLEADFAPRRISNDSALICAYFGKDEVAKVVKVNCPAGLEIAFTKMLFFPYKPLDDIEVYALSHDVTAVCIDPAEPECKNSVFVCDTYLNDGKEEAESRVDKACLNTDKGYHLVSEDNIFDRRTYRYDEIFYRIICSDLDAEKSVDKGCNQDTGYCNK